MSTPCIITRDLRRIHLRPLTIEEIACQEKQRALSTFWARLEALANKQSETQPLAAIKTNKQEEHNAEYH